MSREQRDIAALRRLGKKLDPREAVRRWSGMTVQDISSALGCARSDLNLMLAPQSPRRYPHWQREFEQLFGLEPYALEPLIEEWKTNGR